MLYEQRVREQGTHDGLSVSRRRRRRWRHERAARRLILLGPRSDDFGRFFGRSGRRRFAARRRRFVAEYVGDAERLDAGRGLRVLGRRTGDGPATLLCGRRHRHHVDATRRRRTAVEQRCGLRRRRRRRQRLMLLVQPVRPTFGRVALAIANAVAHLVDLHRAQLLQRFEVIGTAAGRRRVGSMTATVVVQPGVTVGRRRRRRPADAYVVRVVGHRAPGRSAPSGRGVTAQVGRVTAVVTTLVVVVVGGGAQQCYGFHAIRDRSHQQHISRTRSAPYMTVRSMRIVYYR